MIWQNLLIQNLIQKINTDIVSVDLGDGKILEVRQYLPSRETWTLSLR